uniref:ATP synthase F0 subunit 8 n=1 Tax=Decemunciger sp. AB-2017 TaxID=1980157 RepID=A0A1X9ZNR7_9ANNE|nr:ATP synthase F0 subunit 8 [Decemunciger sp. AB-2017]ASK06192.1 ATP synthase F0 subunit 8 [Decemunciger sp. AB-2017]ASK06205.1 ATP synthase F0 subunit 8 [Decemunciger sp. AB-2017]
MMKTITCGLKSSLFTPTLFIMFIFNFSLVILISSSWWAQPPKLNIHKFSSLILPMKWHW